DSRNLSMEGSKTVGKDWQTLRSQLIEHRLRLWKRITETIDPNWNPKDRPVSKVILEDGEAGMSPDSIIDPPLRAEYRRAVNTNEEKRVRYNEQLNARALQKRYTPRLKEAIADAYKMPPATNEDLNTLKK